MAKKKKSKKARKTRKGGGSQRAKFKKAAGTCRREVGDTGVKAFSPASWKMYGKCMKKEL